MESITRYDSEGKHYNRTQWERHCLREASGLGRRLTGVWLTDDDFTDVMPLLPVLQQLHVAETGHTHHRVKREFLESHPLAEQIVQLQDTPESILTTIQRLMVTRQTVDVINLDYCIAWCPDTERTVALVFREHLLRSGGLLFLTVAARSCANRRSSPAGKTLASKLMRVVEQVQAEADMTGWSCTMLPGYPKPYHGVGRKNPCPMFSYGWRCTFTPDSKEEDFMIQMTDLDKQRMASLRECGVSSNIIAQAFDVTPGAVAAYVAHAHRSSQRRKTTKRQERTESLEAPVLTN